MEYFPVIDAHTHVFPDAVAPKARSSVAEFYNIPTYTTGTFDHIKQIFTPPEENPEHYKVVRALVSNPATSAKQVASINTFMGEIHQQDDRFVCLGTMHRDFEAVDEELDRIVELGLKGIKIHNDFQNIPLDDPKYMEVYRKIAARGLPILFHMGDAKTLHTRPHNLVNVKRQVPDLVVLASHMGGYMNWDAAFEAPVLENVYYDLSSTLRHVTADQVKRMLDKFGEDHFFFGSDFPVCNPYEDLDRLHAMDLGDDTFRHVCYDNFLAFEDKFLK